MKSQEEKRKESIEQLKSMTMCEACAHIVANKFGLNILGIRQEIITGIFPNTDHKEIQETFSDLQEIFNVLSKAGDYKFTAEEYSRNISEAMNEISIKYPKIPENVVRRLEGRVHYHWAK